MQRIKLLIIHFLLLPVFAACTQEPVFISPDNQNIKYMGRIDFSASDKAVFYWPGTSAAIKFKGTSVKALLGDENGKNFYNVIIDDSLHILNCDHEKRWYVLAENLKDKAHTVELFKRTEWDQGETRFYGFELNPGARVLKPEQEKKNRVIEFFGNSITAGYANEDYSDKDSPDSIYTNNYMSYAAITARHFDADYYCTAKGGIGILVSWFPMVMPEMYNRLDPEDPNSKWDFSKVTPDIVVINLFQNDSWLVNMPEHEQFKARFGEEKPGEKEIIKAYQSFTETIRETYPAAHIICALGSMDATKAGSPWPGYIEEAVERLDDKKIYTHFFPFIQKPGHPKVEDHQKMAQSLTQFIKNNIEW